MTVYGLVDCNNFFVSCERVFRPALEGRPAVVLSLNDGCIVSRSDEAKALGVKMGQPVFQVQALIRVAPTFVLKCVSSEGWHVQWETDPPGQESEPRSLGCIGGGNEADEANRQSHPWDGEQVIGP